MKTNNNNITINNLGAFTSKLQEKDKNYANISKRMQYLYWILIPIYLIIGIFEIIFENPSTNEMLSLFFFASAMLIFALTFRTLHKEYNFVDYSEPTLIMLKKVVKRYTPYQPKTRWVFLAIIFIDAGLCLKEEFGEELLYTQLMFFGALLIGICIGLIIWFRRYKPLRDTAKQLIDEIEETV